MKNLGGSCCYSWTAATAGTGTSGVTSGNASSSICPKGWKLPTGGTTGNTEFYNLFNSIKNSSGASIYENDTLKTSGGTNWKTPRADSLKVVQDVPYNFKHNGFISNGSLGDDASVGNWWSSTAYSTSSAYALTIFSTSVYPGMNFSERHRGYAVRCVAREPDLSGITTMQEMTPGVCEKTAVGTSKTLKDSRDDNSYKVQKFADGRCWMTENLRIYNRTISAADSDFTSGSITLPNSSMSDFANNDTSKYNYRSTLQSSANSGSTGYYNWYTATASAGNSSVTTNNQNVNTSICPKGWKLPSDGSDSATSEFGKFASAESIANSAAGSTKIQGSPYNFKYTGRVYDDSLSSDTSLGSWWSSTASSAANAYYLYITSSNVAPNMLNYYRYYGFAVRCIARDS